MEPEIIANDSDSSLITMKKEVYDQMLEDLIEMNNFFYYLTNKTFEEHKHEQVELAKMYNSEKYQDSKNRHLLKKLNSMFS